jgi:hypothetical protein
MPGPLPKPAHLRQRRNRKPGSAVLDAADSPISGVPPLPNPDGREWHPLTLWSWQRAWESPMSSQWLVTDADALGRVALLWDQFYKQPDAKVLGEIRLQEQRFGLSPLDRSRLQWVISRAEESERPKPAVRRTTDDPRKILQAVK